MSVLNYLLLTVFTYNLMCVNSAYNDTKSYFPESFINFTAGNDLWSSLLRDCSKPSFSCVRNSTYKYLKGILGYRDDVQFTSFLKFSKNSFDYDQYKRSFKEPSNSDNVTTSEGEKPDEDMARSLNKNAAEFFMTHDVEVRLPDIFFLGTTMKISPRSLEDDGALVKLELMPKEVENSVGEGRIFFKKIKKFISERLIYALLAILLVIKLLAVKILFVLPTIVGVAAAKKLILKVLLFLFPALHHLFKFCAYVPYGAKHHIHKHQISHIHEVAHGHHHHGPHHKPHGNIEVISPHAEGPPSLHHYSDTHKDFYDPYDNSFGLYPGDSYYGDEIISNRNDPDQEENEIESLGQGHGTRRTKPANSGRPLTPTEIENLILKAEKEALIKARLQKEKQKIHEENLRLQEQLNNALKLQENLKHQTAAIIRSKISQKLNPPPTENRGNVPLPNQFLNPPYTKPSIPAELKGGSTPPRPQIVQGHSPAQQFVQPSVQQFAQQPSIQQSTQNSQNQVLIYQPRPPQTDKRVIPQQDHEAHNVESNEKRKQNFKDNIYKAASITYDPFYSRILENIDKILRDINFEDEPCKERLICSMYKNPSKFSPHSNLLSVELSRDSRELQKPTTTNSAVIRFYKYVQAARDGQDKRDCLRLYPTCSINTEL